MTKVQLTAQSIEDIDGGRVAEALNQQIAKIVQDCWDRPHAKGARNAILKIKATPVLRKDDNRLAYVNVQFEIDSKTPKLESLEYAMEPHGDSLFFRPMAPENPGQMTIDDVIKTEEVAHAQ